MEAKVKDILDSLNTRCVDVDRAAESLGVAAYSVGTGSLGPDQMRLVAEGLREVQGDLHDLGAALRNIAHQTERV